MTPKKLVKHEFGGTLEFAMNHETLTFYQLAEKLMTTPAIVERNFRQEANAKGQLDYFLRSALLRQLYYYVPNGVGNHGEWKLIRAISSWIGMVGNTRELEAFCKKVGDAIQHDPELSADWLPSSTSDPRFMKYFEH